MLINHFLQYFWEGKILVKHEYCLAWSQTYSKSIINVCHCNQCLSHTTDCQLSLFLFGGSHLGNYLTIPSPHFLFSVMMELKQTSLGTLSFKTGCKIYPKHYAFVVTQNERQTGSERLLRKAYDGYKEKGSNEFQNIFQKSS